MSTGNESGLSRWARLKRKSAKGETVEDAPEPAATETAEPSARGRGGAAPTAGKPYLPPLADTDTPVPENALILPEDAAEDDDARELTEEEAAYMETLPPLDELNPESDFSGYMDKRVPEFLRRQALRKLWLSDPAFGFIDGMHEYGEDYSMMAQLAAGASAYRPNEGGYAWRDDPKRPETEETTENGEAQAADGRAASPEAEASPPDAAVDDDGEESIAAKAKRVQDRGGSSVRLPTYTPNPYYQSPEVRHPAPEILPEPARALETTSDSDDNDLGEAEDDLT